MCYQHLKKIATTMGFGDAREGRGKESSEIDAIGGQRP